MKKYIKNLLIFTIIISLLSISLFGCIATQTAEGESLTEIFGSESPNSDTQTDNSINDDDFIVDENIEPNDDIEVIVEEDIIPMATYVQAKIGSLNVRSGKGLNYASLGVLDKGDMVLYIDENNGWYTTYYRNQLAYVSSSPIYTKLYTMIASENEDIENTILYGGKVLGTPYVYGAVRLHNGYGVLYSKFSMNAFDCSSLMQYMFYYGANINLQVTTRTQIYQGEFVSKENLKRGDLMFFTNASRYYYSGINRVGHVAIYLGDNFILQTASDHAVIEEISSLRWSYFIEGRRII